MKLMTNRPWIPIMHVLVRGTALAIIVFVLVSITPAIVLIRDYAGDPYLVSLLQPDVSPAVWWIGFLSVFSYVLVRLYFAYAMHLILVLGIVLLPQPVRVRGTLLLLIIGFQLVILVAERRMAILSFVIE